MKISSIESVKPMTNKVLVRIESRYINTIKVGDQEISLDTSFEPEQHTTSKGVVVAVCDKLTHGKDGNKMPWETDIEIIPGDQVYFSWMAVDRAFGRDAMILQQENQTGEEVYIHVDYTDLTLAVRGGNIIMLNGYCLVEPILESDLPECLGKMSFLEVTTAAKKRLSPTWGRIVSTGSCNKSYVGGIYHDDDCVYEGQIIAFVSNSNIPLQYDIHSDLIGNKTLYKIQRRYMLAAIQ